MIQLNGYCIVSNLPDKINNMFPDDYANNKLSLIINVPRKVITIEIKNYKKESAIVDYEYDIYPSSIIIKKRYNYFDSLIKNLNENDIELKYLYNLIYTYS